MDPWWWWTVSWASHFGARSCGTANINGLAAPLANASHLFKRSDERSESETLIRATSCQNIAYLVLLRSTSKFRRSCDYICTFITHTGLVSTFRPYRIARVIHSSGYFPPTRRGSCPRRLSNTKIFFFFVIYFKIIYSILIIREMDNTKMFIYAYSYTFSLQKSDDIIDDVQ